MIKVHNPGHHGFPLKESSEPEMSLGTYAVCWLTSYNQINSIVIVSELTGTCMAQPQSCIFVVIDYSVFDTVV